MPRALPAYNAISTAETVQFQISSGAGIEFVVWRDIDSDVKLVKCDLCGRFMPLQGRSMSMSSFKRHRNGAGCKELIKQNANQISDPGPELGFINTFQAEVGPSNLNVHLPCEFMSFQISIWCYANCLSCCTAPNIITPAGSGPTTPTATHFASGNLPPSSPPSEWENSPLSEKGSDSGLADDNDNIPDDVCTGQLVQWLAGSVWDTYAYQQHDEDVIGWTPIGYENGNWIRLQSKSCNIFLESLDELNRRSCSECFNLLNSKALLEFMDRAGKDSVTHMPWKYLNTKQLKNMLLASRMKLKLVHLKVCLRST